jgi:CBS-domain-containing membrane protein
VPEEFLGEISDMDDVLEYAQHIRARTAADIMLEPVALHVNQTVRDAFEVMHKAHVNGLPIVDDKSRVTGYVDQLEMLMVWVQATGRSGMLQPSPNDADRV